MERSPEIGKLIGALSKAQGEFTPIVKDKTAQIKSDKGSYSYKYSDLASIISAVTPVLLRHGLAVSQHPEQTEQGIIVTTLLGHESGEFIVSGYTVPGAKLTAQNVGSIITFARRYALTAILGISPDEDNDAGEQEVAQVREPRTVSNTVVDSGTLKALGKLLKEAGFTSSDSDKTQAQEFVSFLLGRAVRPLTELEQGEAKAAIRKLEGEVNRDKAAELLDRWASSKNLV